jgi:hypothetical protein
LPRPYDRLFAPAAARLAAARRRQLETAAAHLSRASNLERQCRGAAAIAVTDGHDP